MTHSWITFFVVTVCGIFGYEWFGLVGTFAFWAGREVAQAEYRCINSAPNPEDRLRKNMPWYGGFIPKYWDKHSFLIDLVYPYFVGLTIALIYYRIH